MADSWNWPALINKIAQDVPFLQRALNALLKQDPTPISDIPSGAKRLYEVSSDKWQWQEYNGSSWVAVPYLQHNVDQLDGYHAAITPAANTVAVRNASGLLQDSITGNAATASSAATLSQTLPVNKGGTGATTSAQARTNLGVPPTSHASSGTAYGLGSNLNYGHVRGDGETTNIVTGEVVVKDVAIGGNANDLASKRGQIGKDYLLPDGGDLNDLRTPGNYGVRGATWKNAPEKTYARIQVINGAVQSSGFVGGLTQLWCTIGQQYVHWFYRSFVSSTQTWSDWVKFVDETDLATSSTPGIVKPGTGMTVDAAGALNVSLNNTVTSTSTTQAATANAVKMAYDIGRDSIKNTRTILTTSGTYTAPVTGWYHLELRGGGGGGGAGRALYGTTAIGGGGGSSGAIVHGYAYLTSGGTYNYTIGAGGAGGTVGVSSGIGKSGGSTTFNGLTADGGSPGKEQIAGQIQDGYSGGSGGVNSFPNGGCSVLGGVGGGVGHGRGGDGGGGVVQTGGGDKSSAGKSGRQGCVILDYFDPEKENK